MSQKYCSVEDWQCFRTKERKDRIHATLVRAFLPFDDVLTALWETYGVAYCLTDLWTLSAKRNIIFLTTPNGPNATADPIIVKIRAPFRSDDRGTWISSHTSENRLVHRLHEACFQERRSNFSPTQLQDMELQGKPRPVESHDLEPYPEEWDRIANAALPGASAKEGSIADWLNMRLHERYLRTSFPICSMTDVPSDDKLLRRFDEQTGDETANSKFLSEIGVRIAYSYRLPTTEPMGDRLPRFVLMHMPYVDGVLGYKLFSDKPPRWKKTDLSAARHCIWRRYADTQIRLACYRATEARRARMQNEEFTEISDKIHVAGDITQPQKPVHEHLRETGEAILEKWQVENRNDQEMLRMIHSIFAIFFAQLERIDDALLGDHYVLTNVDLDGRDIIFEPAKQDATLIDIERLDFQPLLVAAFPPYRVALDLQTCLEMDATDHSDMLQKMLKLRRVYADQLRTAGDAVGVSDLGAVFGRLLMHPISLVWELILNLKAKFGKGRLLSRFLETRFAEELLAELTVRDLKFGFQQQIIGKGRLGDRACEVARRMLGSKSVDVFSDREKREKEQECA